MSADSRRVRPAQVSEKLRWLLPYGVRGQTRPERERVLVAGGVRWLADQQLVDGGWSRSKASSGVDDMRPGLTALALLAILGAGHSPEGSGPYAETLRRGLEYLASKQDRTGAVGGLGATNVQTYGHAFATQALVEAAAVTGDPARIALANKALGAVDQARNPYFVWRYGKRSGENDTSVSGCMWTALFAALAANRAASIVGVPGPFVVDPDSVEGMHAWLEKMTDPDSGRVGYTSRGEGAARSEAARTRFPPEKSESMTAIGVWSRLSAGVVQGRTAKPDRAVELGLTLLLNALPRKSGGQGAIDFYYWHYGSLAMSLAPPKLAQAWNAGLDATLEELLTPEDKGHHWKIEDPWSELAGPVYLTSMATLALEARWRYRTPTVPELFDLAGAPGVDPEARARALRTLALRKAPRLEATVDSFLAAPTEALRVSAVSVVELTNTASRHTSGLKAALADPNPAVAVPAARALGRAGKGADAALAPGFVHASPVVRAAAFEAAVGLGTGPALDAAKTALADGDSNVRAAAACMLVSAGGDPSLPLPVLTRLLASPSEPVRLRALAGLRALGGSASDSSEAIAPLLRDTSLAVRIVSSSALIAIKGPSAPELRTLREALGTEDPLMRELAAQQLGALGTAAGSEIDALARALLTDPDVVVRAAAAHALGQLGREGRDALRALESACLDPDSEVARAAGVGVLRVRDGIDGDGAVVEPKDLGELRTILSQATRAQASRGGILASPSSLAWLETLTKDGDVGVRIRSLELLGDLAAAGKVVPAALTDAATDPDAGVRCASLRALARVAVLDSAAFKPVVAASLDADSRVRSAAFAILAAARTASPERIAACAAALDAVLGPSGAEAEGDALRAVEALHRWKVRAKDEVWSKVVAAARGSRYLALSLRAIRALPTGFQRDAPVFVSLLALRNATPSREIHQAADAALDAMLEANPRK